MPLVTPLTVLIPAHNEERTLASVVHRCLRSSEVTQVVVVNNASVDNTALVAQESGAEVIDCPTLGLGYAIKTGLRSAKNQWVLKVDGDITNFDTDWITAIASRIGPNVGMVKSYWDHEVSGWPETYFLIKPILRRLDPALAAIRMPISAIYAVDLSRLDVDILSNDWSIDLDLLYRVSRAGAIIREIELPAIAHTERPLTSYFGMADELLNYLLRVSKRHAAQRLTLILAHCDDAEIWVGGTMINHLLDGGTVDLLVIFSTEERRAEAGKTGAAFKSLRIHHLGLSEFSSLSDTGLRDHVAAFIRATSPAGIITHSPSDPHPDHSATGGLVHAALLTLEAEVCPKQLLFCNSYFAGQASRAAFNPDTFVDISSVAALKYDLIRNHTSQDPAFWIQMSENMDILNGMRCGVARAEAFERSPYAFFQHATDGAV